MDIRDSTGKRLIRDLGAKGDKRRVSGVAPFQVLLGYGPGVKIEYDGKNTFIITSKGRQYLDSYVNFSSIAESFGLEL